jgi:hypothetical protein
MEDRPRSIDRSWPCGTHCSCCTSRSTPLPSPPPVVTAPRILRSWPRWPCEPVHRASRQESASRRFVSEAPLGGRTLRGSLPPINLRGSQMESCHPQDRARGHCESGNDLAPWIAFATRNSLTPSACRQPDSDAHKTGTDAGPTGRCGRDDGVPCPGPSAGRGVRRCLAGWPPPNFRRAPLSVNCISTVATANERVIARRSL